MFCKIVQVFYADFTEWANRSEHGLLCPAMAVQLTHQLLTVTARSGQKCHQFKLHSVYLLVVIEYIDLFR